MKKSLLALAVLGAFAGTAMAQSSVTVYGLIDENLGKDLGSVDKRMSQGGSSRLGFRGVEDLGGGSAAFFQIEHRFRPFNGTINGGNGVNGSPVTFWQARSYVGLRGGWGEVRLGREYDGAFFHGEVVGDPWGWDTVVSSMTVVVMAGTATNYFNVNRAVTYNSPTFSGFSFTYQVAEANNNCGQSGLNASQLSNTATSALGKGNTAINGNAFFQTCDSKPYSWGASYAGGPLRVGVGYNNPGNANDNWLSTNAQYDFGVAKLWGFYGKGKNIANQDVKSSLLAVTVPLGQGEFRAAVMRKDDNNVRNITGTGLAYFYSLSKRTTLYTDYARNSALKTEPNAYDFGIKHVF